MCRLDVVDDSKRLLVPAKLQISVDKIVLPVQLIANFLAGLGGLHGCGICSDRFLPITDPRKNMRGHVLRVGRVRCDLCIAQRRRQAPGGNGRIIVQMDQVVSDTWMLRLSLKDRFEDGRALELIGVGLVGRRCRNVERNRIEDLCLVVGGITGRQRFHGLKIRLNAFLMCDLVIIDVHHR